ncbi:hypothetical protein Taro_015203 [Colocasia esculenta]|uniref:Uncharacterized protein n=1 Tax=Colocasia esculenta TaxID=4460 RepID=A0A843UK77_COLES|nr:hypothetical protein [Colocasia esculenta]
MLTSAYSTHNTFIFFLRNFSSPLFFLPSPPTTKQPCEEAAPATQPAIFRPATTRFFLLHALSFHHRLAN